MSWSLGWPAPAKINRFLRVVGRRDDGYHLLETAFQFLDLADELAFRVRHDDVIRRVDPNGWGSDDLAVRAARRLAAMTDGSLGADIHIRKRLPAGGGVGGGSSDAATTLVALNRLWGLDCPINELADRGLALGADVPVFVQGQAAWAEGVGERLYSLDVDDAWLVLLDPGVPVATEECFAAPELTRDSPPSKIRRLDAARDGNAFEPVVRRRYPVVGDALDWLGEQLPAYLTGSGGCCFAIGRSEQEVERVAAAVPEPWQAFPARAVSHSPLHGRLAQAANADYPSNWGVAKR